MKQLDCTITGVALNFSATLNVFLFGRGSEYLGNPNLKQHETTYMGYKYY